MGLFKVGKTKQRVAVIGGGSWATAIVKILSDSGLPKVYWWVREPEIVEGVKSQGRNPMYLSSVQINPKKVVISNHLARIIARCEYIVLVTPSAFLHETLKPLKKSRIYKKKIIIAVKGIVPESMQIVTDYLNSEFKVPFQNLAIITGPSHAEEIAQEKYTFLTSASENSELADFVASMFHCRYVKVTVSRDILGAEYATVLKNIYALGAGIYSGMGYGDNFIAAYIANSLKEMHRFVSVVYPNNRHIEDSVYLGDLLVTSYSHFSRNRRFGNMIGRGFSVKTTQMEMNMVAEGYYASRCIHEINKNHCVNIPIVETIYGILYEDKNAVFEMKRLAEQFV